MKIDLALRVLIVVAGVFAAVVMALKGQGAALPALAAGGILGACVTRFATSSEYPLLLAGRSLDAAHVLGLQPLRALLDVELDLLALVQSSVTLRLNRGVVDEHVLTAVSLDEAVAFVVVEPLHYANFWHLLHLRPGRGGTTSPPVRTEPGR